MFFCTLDDIIKKSVWLAKTAKVIDPHLGWYNPQVYFPPLPTPSLTLTSFVQYKMFISNKSNLHLTPWNWTTVKNFVLTWPHHPIILQGFFVKKNSTHVERFFD